MRPSGGSPRDRLWRLVTRRSSRIGLLVAVGYVTAIAGVTVGLAGNAGNPSDPTTAAAIALLFVSFLSMFQASRSLVGISRKE